MIIEIMMVKEKKQYYDDKYYTKILEPPETKKGAEEVI